MVPTRAQLASWRARLDTGDVQVVREVLACFEALERIEKLAADARRALANEEGTALEKRLNDVSRFGGECRTCHNAEARALLAKLKRLAAGG